MSIYHHFRPEERPLAEKLMEWSENVSYRKQVKLTHFLDPREQYIAQAIAGSFMDIHILFDGAYEGAERKRACIVPDFLNIEQEDFCLSLMEINLQDQKLSLEHRDVLGSIIGLGLKRDILGDILISENHVQFITTNEMSNFISTHLHQIGRYKVSCQELSLEDLIAPKEDWIYKDTTVSSLRLDNILAELLSLSRTKSMPLIKSGKVKVNWRVAEQPSLQLEAGDSLSVKGFGRFLFAEVSGRTKKDKYRVRLGKKS